MRVLSGRFPTPLGLGRLSKVLLYVGFQLPMHRQLHVAEADSQGISL
jgi:hypothetical protein